MRAKLLILIIFSAFAFSSPVAWGQEDKSWDFELAPLYLWAINIDGDMVVRGRDAETSVDFSDIWDSLEGVFTMRFNGLYKQRFGFLVDYNYLDLGTEQQTDTVNIDVGFKSQILNAGATYRFLNGRHTVDGLAGIRWTMLEAEVDLNNIGSRVDADKDWIDPIVGIRYGFHMTDKWALRLCGDIGGFGISSDFTWQGLGLIDFQPWKHVAIIGGYRAIATDYTSGSGRDQFTYDAIVHGPVLGLDVRF